MRIFFWNCLITLLCFIAPLSYAQSPAQYTSCIACHGEEALGNPALGAPALAGQDTAYLQRQLENFKSGLRGSEAADVRGAQMRAMAVSLSDGDIAALAEYLGGLPPVSSGDEWPGDVRKGGSFYQGNCGACHGGQAQGNAGLNSPNLAILDAEYLKLQFQNFKEGLRGGSSEDRLGMQMKMMASTVPDDKTLDDVIAHIQSLATP